MGNRQQEKSLMTKAELKEAAKRLFLEKGYEETSIQDIAGLAGYSVGSVYRQWKGKKNSLWISGMIMYRILSAPAFLMRLLLLIKRQ